MPRISLARALRLLFNIFPLMKTRALAVTAINTVTCASVEIPQPAPGQLLVETELSAISPGTELRCLAGLENQSAGFPFIPGYSCLGRVVASGPGCTTPIGTRVFAGATAQASIRCQWGGHVAHAVVDEAKATPIPEAIPARSAVLLKLAAISHRGFALAPSVPGTTVAVVGLGPIGMLSALIHRAHGARVVGLDLIPARIQLAQSLGLEAARSDAPEARTLLPQGAEIVVDSSGVPAVLPSALGWLGEVAWNQPDNASRTLVLQGSYGPRDIQLPYVECFFKEIRLVVPRDELASDRQGVLSLMASGKLDAAPLCSRTERPENAQAVYQALIGRDPSLQTAAFDWRS